MIVSRSIPAPPPEVNLANYLILNYDPLRPSDSVVLTLPRKRERGRAPSRARLLLAISLAGLGPLLRLLRRWLRSRFGCGRGLRGLRPRARRGRFRLCRRGGLSCGGTVMPGGTIGLGLALRAGLFRFRRLGGRLLRCSGLRGLAAARRLAAGPLRARGDERQSLVQRDRLRRLVAGQGGVDTVMGDVGPVAAVLHQHGAALVRMVAERAAGVAAEAAARALGDFLRDQRHRAVEADVEHIVARLDIGVGLAVLDIGAVAPDPGDDGLAAFGVTADFPRQRQQLQRHFEIDGAGIGAAQKARALGLLAFR